MTLKVVLMITKEKQRTPNVVLQSHKAIVISRLPAGLGSWRTK